MARGLTIPIPRQDTYFYAAAVTPNDTTDLSVYAQALWIGVGAATNSGNVKVDLIDGGTGVVIPAVPTGTLITIGVKRVYATGTTATNIVALS